MGCNHLRSFYLKLLLFLFQSMLREVSNGKARLPEGPKGLDFCLEVLFRWSFITVHIFLPVWSVRVCVLTILTSKFHKNYVISIRIDYY